MLMNPMVMMMGVTLLIMVAPPVQECHTAEPCLALGRGSGRLQLGPVSGVMHAPAVTPAPALRQFAMPKMMANMDPEQLEEMKQMQSSMGGSWKDMLDPEKLKEKQQALQQKEKGGGKKKNKD